MSVVIVPDMSVPAPRKGDPAPGVKFSAPRVNPVNLAPLDVEYAIDVSPAEPVPSKEAHVTSVKFVVSYATPDPALYA